MIKLPLQILDGKRKKENSTYLPMGLLEFLVATLVGWKISFPIQGVHMLHTFDEPCYRKNEK